MDEDHTLELRLLNECLPAARDFLRSKGVPGLLGAVEIHEQCYPGTIRSKQAWMAAVTGVCLAGILQDAMSVSGRQVVERICQLHRSLQDTDKGSTRGGVDESLARELGPCLEWWNFNRRAGSVWKRVWIGWIEVLSERLTMSRYSDPMRRSQHAQILLVTPLSAIRDESSRLEKCGLVRETDDESGVTGRYCEWMIRFWDLAHAERMAGQGWNRISFRANRQMGGFYALDDHPETVNRDVIMETARSLWLEIGKRDGLPDGGGKPHGDWFSRLHQQLETVLGKYLETGVWPGMAVSGISAGGEGRTQAGRLKKFFKPGD